MVSSEQSTEWGQSESASVLVVGVTEARSSLAEAVSARINGSITWVDTGMDALGALSRGPVDCVVSRQTLPNSSGLTLLKRVRERYPALPFVLFPAEGSEQLVTDAIEAGVTDYVSAAEAGAPSVVANSVSQAVEQRQRRREFETETRTCEGIVRASHGGILTLDAEGTIRSASDRATEILGQTPRELIDTPVTDLDWRVLGTDEMPVPDADHPVSTVGETGGSIRDRQFELVIEEERRAVSINATAVPTDDTVERVIVSLTDITAQRRQQEQLNESRSQLRALFEESPDPVYVHDATGKILDVSQQAVEMLGYDRAELLDMSIWEIEVEADRAELVDMWAEFPDEETVSMSGRHQRADGEEIPVEVHTNSLVVDGDRQFVAHARDISAHATAREQLEASERALSDLYDVLADADQSFEEKLSAVLDIGCQRLDLPIGYMTRIEDGRQHIVAATGDHELIQPGESAPLEESYCRKPIESDDQVALSDVLDAGWADDPAYETYELGCYLGGTIEVEGDSYGTLCFAGHTAREQTFTEAERAFAELLTQWASYELERREANQQLEREHDLFRRTEQMADIGAWELAVESDRLYWTEQVRAIHGVDADFEPTVERALDFYHPEDRDTLEQALDRTIETGESYDETVRLVTPDGTEKWVRTMGEPHRVDDDTLYIRGTIQDITERREMEAAIRDQNRNLETILDNVPTILFELDADGEFVRVRGQGMDALPMDATLFEGKPAPEVFDGYPIIRRNVDRALDGEQVHDVIEFAGTIFETWYEPIMVDGDLDRVIWTAMDVTEREAHEQTLSDLHDLNRDLLGATTSEEVLSVVFEGANEILDLATVTLLRYDDQQGGLVPAEYTDRVETALGEVPEVWPADSNAWTAFEQGIIVSRSDLSKEGLDTDDEPGAGAFIPLGEYGVLIVGGPDESALDEQTLDLANTLAATAEAALARVDREQAVQDREQQLREAKAFTDGLIDSLPDIMFALDADGEFIRWNDRLLSVTGYPADRLQTMQATDLVSEDDRVTAATQLEQAKTGSLVREDLELLTATGEKLPYEFTVSPIEREGTVAGIVGIGRDISAQVEYEQTLTTLHEVTRDLLRAESQSAISDHVVTAAEQSLDFEGVAVFLFDETDNVLRPTAYSESTTDLIGTVPSFGPGEGIAWQVFVEGEGRVYDDVRQDPDVHNPDTPFRTEVLIPLGDHGVLVAGKTTPNAMDDRTLELAQILAANCETALARSDREQALRDRDQELKAQNARLEQLREINEKIRRIDHALVGADTRSEIEATVAERLAAIDRFPFAWVGSLDPVEDTITPAAWDGAERGYLDSIDLSGSEPASRAARTGEPVIVDAVADDLRSEPWRQAALSRNFLSVAAIPLVYDGVTDGVVTVYADQPGAFSEMARDVLVELGETVAHAITAVEQKQALIADSQVELEFAIPTERTALTELVAQLDCTLSVDSLLPQSDGTALVYVTVEGATAEAVMDAAASLVTLDRVRDISTTDEVRLELRSSGGSMAATVAEHGARLERMTVEDGQSRVLITLPETADVRSFIDTFIEKYPGSELYARRRTFDETADAGASSPFEELTPRQAEAIKVAFYSGFFEWPRESTGEEIADTLDVSPPTFLEHLRRAEAKLLDTVVETESIPAPLD